jgi:hypothetical protein
MMKIAFLPAITMIVGCTPTPPPTVAIADARAVVETALASWRKAEPVQTLRDSADSILVAEPRWESGWKLDGYEFVGETVDGFQARCKVQLSLKDPAGNSSRETAEYVATAAPKRTVTRVSEGW